MKHKIQLNIIGLLLICILGACSSDNDSPKQTLFFKLSQVNVMAADGESSNSFNFSEGDSIGLYLQESVNQSSSSTTSRLTDLLYNSPCGYDGSKWNLMSELGFDESQEAEKLSLTAYYPYSSSNTSRSFNFQVQTDQSTEEALKASDFMYGTTTTTVGSCGNTTLQMSHMMARLIINVNYANADIKQCNSIELKAYTSCSINLSKGTLITGTTNKSIKGYTNSASSTKQQIVFIIPPQQLSKNCPLQFIYDNNTFDVVVNQEIEGEKQYTLDFTSYGEDKISYNGIQVDNWQQFNITQGAAYQTKISYNGIQVDNWQQFNITQGALNKIEVYQTGDVIVYSKCTQAKPVTMVVTGDGYTIDDMEVDGTFKSAARRALDYLFSVEPFKTYKSYFSVYIIAAVSNQSGASNNTTGVKRDTYFGTGWSDNYDDMDVKSYTQLFNFVNSYCPDIKEGKTTIYNTGVYVLVNENRYGGITSSFGDGRNYAIIPTISGNLNWESDDPDNKYYTGQWPNIFMHECGGHAFGRLYDEYFYDEYGSYPYSVISAHNQKVPFGLNITTDYNNANGTCYWAHMLNSSRYPRVGFYEGGYGYPKNIWRAEVISGMCDNRPYFNAISRQLIVERIMTIAGETFSLDDFYAKDVNIDPVRDTNKSRTQSSYTDAKLYPRLPAPKLK